MLPVSGCKVENDTVNRHTRALAGTENKRRRRDTDKWNISGDLIRGNGVWTAGDTRGPAPTLAGRKLIACLKTVSPFFLCVCVGVCQIPALRSLSCALACLRAARKGAACGAFTLERRQPDVMMQK